MYFHYTALNTGNKRLSGVIEAETQVSAEQKLNELGYSIVDLKLIVGELLATPGMTRFSFTAADKKNKKVTGTIEAKSFDEAFQKLNDEYELDLEKLFAKDATPEEKEKSISQIAILQKSAKKEGKTQEKSALQEQEKEKQELLKLVEHTMQTMGNFLKQYENDMKPDERDTIRSYIDQLARIKDSTNLDHIRKTSENLLKHIREKEIFLKEKQREQMEMQMKVEAKTLLFDIQHTGLKTEIDILSMAEKLTILPAPWGKFFAPAGRFILGLFGADDKDVRMLYRELKKIRKKFFELFRLGYFSGNETLKIEARREIRSLLAERKRLKIQLTALKTKQKLKKLEGNLSLSAFPGFSLFFGWLLAFYLLFHFFTFPFIFYETGLKSIPKSFFVFRSPILLGLMAFLFMFHITLTLKKSFLPRHFLSTFLLVPSSVMLFLFFLFNLVV